MSQETTALPSSARHSTDKAGGGALTVLTTLEDWTARPGRTALIPTALLVFLFIDAVEDHHLGAPLLHLVVEWALLFGTAAWLMLLTLQLGLSRRRERAAHGSLARVRQETERFRAEAAAPLEGLGAAIEARFAKWGLSAAEREVALGLLKGFAHKEIAAARGTSEKTARQQALSVYRKSGLDGRSSFSAFFLNHLSLPAPSPRGHDSSENPG